MIVLDISRCRTIIRTGADVIVKQLHQSVLLQVEARYLRLHHQVLSSDANKSLFRLRIPVTVGFE